ncbi:MAG: MlaD family protein [Abditibacteriales bacterium]|nr:MlaD family protein [Abditibacteriales bacterium]MDW8366361.1 MlaD family protein [Abditibacteriales bacterium]
MLISREARVGIVVGLGILTLVIVVLFFRHVRSSVREYEVTVIVDDAGGILEGADVLFAGVRVGRVKNVVPDLEYQGAKLTLGIDSKYPLYSDYQFAVRSGALLGERYVVITPPADEMRKRVREAQERAQKGARQRVRLGPDFKLPIEGRGPSSVEELIPKTQALMDHFDALMSDFSELVNEVRLLAKDLRGSASALRHVVADPQTQQAMKGIVLNLYQTSAAIKRVASSPQIQGTLANVNRATQSLEQMTKSANRLVKRTDEVMLEVKDMVGFFKDVAKTNRENLDQTIAALPEMMKDLKETTAEIKRVAQAVGSQENLDQINAALKSIRQATENITHITEDVRQLVADEKMRNDVKQIVSTLNEATQSAKKTVENLEATSASLRDLATDAEFQNDLKETLKEMKKTVATAGDALQEGRQTLAQGQQVLARVNRILGGGRGTEEHNASAGKGTSGKKPASSTKVFGTTVEPRLSFWQTPASRRYVGDVECWIAPDRKRGFLLGVHDLTVSDKFTAQYVPALGANSHARLGVYRGRLGVGFDVTEGKARLSLNAYDPNNLTGNVWIGYRLFRNWELMLGVEGLRQHPQQVGVGLRMTK